MVRADADTYLLTMAQFYAGLRREDLPSRVLERARRLLVDFLAELAVSPLDSELAGAYLNYLTAKGVGGQVAILGADRTTSAEEAAMAMGILGHAVELDDGHRWGTAHPAVAVIPAVLATAELSRASFFDILTAIVVGYDVMLRAARSVNPAHLKRGFHSTGTCGALGAAAACAWLWRLEPLPFAYAIAMGGLQSAGLQEMLHDHPGIKPLQAGNAARAGVLAAELARRGVRGPRTLFEGQHGWFKAMCDDQYNAADLIGELGSRFEVMQTYTKLYPTCRHCHASIDLVRIAKQALGFQVDDIQSLAISTYSLGIAEVGQIAIPMNSEEAMFSLPYAVAVAAATGNVRLADLQSEWLCNETLMRLARLVRITADQDMDAMYPEERGARLQLQLHDGRGFDEVVKIPKGEPDNPVTDNELQEKIWDMLRPTFPEAFIARLWHLCVEKSAEDVTYSLLRNHFRDFAKR